MILKKLFVLLSAAVCFLFVTPYLQGSYNERIEWQTNIETGFKLAKEKNSPMFMDFWAIWCGPCRKMEKDVWTHRGLINVSRDFVCVSVDVDLAKNFSKDFRVRVLPTLIIADSAGNELTRFEGYTAAVDLIRVMKAIPTDYSTVQKWVTLLKKDRKNLEALIMVGTFYASERCYSLSNRYFKKALKNKQTKGDPDAQEKIMFSLGMNRLKMGDHKKAIKIFKKTAAKFPKGKYSEDVLFGLINAQLRCGKIKDAEKNFNTLQHLYPDSQAIKIVAENIRRQKEK